VDFMNQYLSWSRATGEVRPTGRFNNNPNPAGLVPTFYQMIARCLGAQYTDLDGVAEGLNYSSDSLNAMSDMKRDPAVENATWDYSSLAGPSPSAPSSTPVGTHYGANDLVMAFVLNKCFGSSAFDAYGVIYNLDDGFGMLTNEQLADAIKVSLQEEEALAAAQIAPTKAVADQLPGDNKGQVDAMFRSLLSIDPQRFYKDGRQITGLFETNTDADASGNWCLAAGDKIEIPVRLFFRAPVTVLTVVDGAKNASSSTPDQVETVFIKGEDASLDAHDRAQAAAADRGNIMSIRLQIVCGLPAISSSTLATSEDTPAPVVMNVANPIFYNGVNYPAQSAMSIVYAGGISSTAGWSVAATGVPSMPNGLAATLSGSACVLSFNPAEAAGVAAGRYVLTVVCSHATLPSVTQVVNVTISNPPQ
jgi:hypothetical protein